MQLDGGSMRHPVRLRQAMILGLLAQCATAHAQSLSVVGQAGVLGEWELTGAVAETTAGKKEYAGPVTMKHVGLCTQDGPETKTGELRLQLASSASRLTATLLIDGVACSYSATRSDAYNGTLRCPDRRDVPLLLWLK